MLIVVLKLPNFIVIYFLHIPMAEWGARKSY
jgi:hypothetical protein